jgi:mRNA interferase ChpB
VKRGDIYLVSLDPSGGHEQSGNRPVLVVSPTEFNKATKLPVVLPISHGGEFARRLGFGVALVGIKTTGVVRCDQPRVLDVAAHHARKADSLPAPLMDEVLAKVATLFEKLMRCSENSASTDAVSTKTMPKTPPTVQQGLVVFAKNKKRVSVFYRRTLGLHVAEEQASHDLLVGSGVELVIHAIPRKYAADIKISKPPRVREDTPFKPSFYVNDLAAVRSAAVAAGGGLKPIEQAWLIRGATVLDGHDPEGNVVQFKQVREG